MPVKPLCAALPPSLNLPFPLSMPPSIRLTRIFSMAEDLAAQLQGLHFANAQAQQALWRPALNMYAHADRLEVCMDLAGVRKQDIQVEVEPRRLTLRGRRTLPQCPPGAEAAAAADSCCRILMMEIPDGEFERVLDLPAAVNTEKVTARQDNGWLWVSLPVLETEDMS